MSPKDPGLQWLEFGEAEYHISNALPAITNAYLSPVGKQLDKASVVKPYWLLVDGQL